MIVGNGLEPIFLFVDLFDFIIEPWPELDSIFLTVQIDRIPADEVTALTAHVINDFHGETGVIIDGSIEKLSQVQIIGLRGVERMLALGLADGGNIDDMGFGFLGWLGIGDTGTGFRVELCGFVFCSEWFKTVSELWIVDFVGCLGFVHIVLLL